MAGRNDVAVRAAAVLFAAQRPLAHRASAAVAEHLQRLAPVSELAAQPVAAQGTLAVELAREYGEGLSEHGRQVELLDRSAARAETRWE